MSLTKAEPQPIGHVDLDGLSAERLREMHIALRHVCEEYAVEANGLRTDLARARRFAADQQRAAENCGHNLEAAEQDVETLREAGQDLYEAVAAYLKVPACDPEGEAFAEFTAAIIKLGEAQRVWLAALDATAPEGEGR